MDVHELLIQAEGRLGELVTEQAAAHHHAEIVDARVAEMREQIAGLRSLVSQLGYSELIPYPQMGDDKDDWGPLTLTSAVLRVLDEATTVMSPRGIQDVLARHGVEVEGPNVSATLNYLKAKGYAENVGHGEWLRVAQPRDQVATDTRRSSLFDASTLRTTDQAV